MRVALISPIARRTPPLHYGPCESVVSTLAEGLVRKGVDVTLFATQDSVTTAKLWAVCSRGYEEDPSIDAKVWECLHLSEAFEHGDEFDLIHNHCGVLPLTYTAMTSTPVLTTIHEVSSPRTLPVYRKYDGRVSYVSISDADRHPELTYEGTVHHGIELEGFTFHPGGGDYLLFFGSIHPAKGTREAIEIARRFGRRLLIAGNVQDQEYFDEQIHPHLGALVEYLGSASPDRKDDLLGGAYALLYPIQFPEPFSLPAVEAMACGTPVVAFRRGGMPETIHEGVTGYLCSTVDEAVDCLRRIGELDRARCRAWVEEKFSASRMVDEYLEIYRRIVSRSQREDHRPWGYYRVLEDKPDHKVKRIVVAPGQRLSLQRHRRRAEHWFVLQGEAIVSRDGEEIQLTASQSIEIPLGAWHRIANPGTKDLELIEVQSGDYFGEDDIERREDDYGRIE